MQRASKTQEIAIQHGEGPMLVMAGPGSGKTFVMIQRVFYLIQQKKVSPDKILVISFSRAAAGELKERFQKQNKGKNLPVYFSTFHAYFFHILKETYHYTSKDIVLAGEKRRFLRTILFDPTYNASTDHHYVPPDRVEEVLEEILHKISFYKNQGMEKMKQKESSWFHGIFHGYNRFMHEERKLDFDDMGLLSLKLFQTDNRALKKWQSQFDYILIDEFQDINEIQFQNIFLLTKEHRNLFVVGDDDQSIYQFRGASPGFMLEFTKYYPDAKRVLLDINFRCNGNIVKKSMEVIKQNKFRVPKDIKSEKEDGKEVILKDFINYYDEYTYICSRIEQYVNEGGCLNSIACIFRTNGQMLLLTDFFIRRQIPFVMKEQGRSIFQHFIAKDILHYLKFFKGGRKRKDFFAVMNKPVRYLSRNACKEEVIHWESLYSFYQGKQYIISSIEELQRMEEWVCKLDLYGAVYYIRKTGEYEKYLKEYCRRYNMLFEEAWDILNYIHDSTKGMDSVLEWEEAIEKYEKNLQESGSREDGIHLITMHGCKGLEFPYVFLPDCNEGKIPHNKAFLKEDVEEERRMFYVAMTRAMEQLEILYIKDPEGRKLPQSRFLDPLTGQKTKKHIKKENDKNILLKTVSNFFSH